MVFIMMPKEFIHDFFGHEDSTDFFHDGAAHIENHHVHCLLLHFEVSAFIYDEINIRLINPVPNNHFSELDINPLFTQYFKSSLLRGPPVS